MTTYFEGSIIRSVRRLEELLNQLASAAKVGLVEPHVAWGLGTFCAARHTS